MELLEEAARVAHAAAGVPPPPVAQPPPAKLLVPTAFTVHQRGEQRHTHYALYKLGGAGVRACGHGRARAHAPRAEPAHTRARAAARMHAWLQTLHGSPRPWRRG